MKKLLAAAALLGMVLVFQPLERAEADAPFCKSFCKEAIGFRSFGACMGACNTCFTGNGKDGTNNKNIGACTCKTIGATFGFPITIFGQTFKNQGQCVRYIQQGRSKK